MIDWIIPARLAAHAKPWEALTLTIEQVATARPVRRYVNDYDIDGGKGSIFGRTANYDRGRVRHFAELYLSGYHLDPLVVDNECTRDGILPLAVLIDGYHRLCGALLAGRGRIPVEYSGRLDVLRWLQGERRRCPLT